MLCLWLRYCFISVARWLAQSLTRSPCSCRDSFLTTVSFARSFAVCYSFANRFSISSAIAGSAVTQFLTSVALSGWSAPFNQMGEVTEKVSTSKKKKNKKQKSVFSVLWRQLYHLCDFATHMKFLEMRVSKRQSSISTHRSAWPHRVTASWLVNSCESSRVCHGIEHKTLFFANRELTSVEFLLVGLILLNFYKEKRQYNCEVL